MVVSKFVHVGGGPTYVSFGLISSEPGASVGRQGAIIFIYLKICCIKWPADISEPIVTVLHSSDRIVATSHLPVGT
jgi:hypothetical protein